MIILIMVVCIYLKFEIVFVRLWMVNIFIIMFWENKLIIVCKFFRVIRFIIKLSLYLIKLRLNFL